MMRITIVSWDPHLIGENRRQSFCESQDNAYFRVRKGLDGIRHMNELSGLGGKVFFLDDEYKDDQVWKFIKLCN
jgi:hypothetical protein